jgi:hypothetical protein
MLPMPFQLFRLRDVRQNKNHSVFNILVICQGYGQNEDQTQCGTYRANFFEAPAFSSGFIKPSSMVAEMTCETRWILLSGSLNRSRSDWFVIRSENSNFNAQC